MDYRDQLVLTGQINSVGEAIMVNVPHSYRLGIEISAGIDFIKQLHLDLAATFSRIRSGILPNIVDVYDSAWRFTGQQSTYLGQDRSFLLPRILSQWTP